MANDRRLVATWKTTEEEFVGSPVGESGFRNWGGDVTHTHVTQIEYDSSLTDDGEALDKLRELAEIPDDGSEVNVKIAYEYF